MHKMAQKRKSDDNRVPVVEKLYRENQESYHEAGGFDTNDDEYAEKRERIAEAMQKKRDRPYEHIDAPENCMECSKPLFDSILWERFCYAVCDSCRDDQGKHKLIARTEAKNEYLLKDCDFDIRKPPLRFISKKNPHNPRYGDMKLYLKVQVEQRALDVYGSFDDLEEARSARIANREVVAEKRFERKIKEMRKEVRGFSHIKIDVGAPHEHEYGEESYDAKKDSYSKDCRICKYRLTYEKM
jgi:DNA-repair protein complementing XP-A cells